MSVAGGPDLIQDGLVLCLDVANTKSYPGSGTSWVDLSRNGNNGTLTNGPTFNSANGGSIVFDGTNDHIVGSLTTSLGSQFSLSAWFKKSNNNLANLFGFQGSPTLELLVDQTNRLNIWDGAGDHFYSFTTTINLWYNMTVVKNASNLLLYINDAPTPVLNFSTTYSNTNTNLILAKHPVANNGYLNGNISQMLIYNFALSKIQIAQNYNATKGRFRL
jgi:Concanavalin A-like lectin/glucanases superfamily